MNYEQIMAQPFIDNNPACASFKAQVVAGDKDYIQWRAQFCEHCGRHKEKHAKGGN